jgi:hypothetical protein
MKTCNLKQIGFEEVERLSEGTIIFFLHDEGKPWSTKNQITILKISGKGVYYRKLEILFSSYIYWSGYWSGRSEIRSLFLIPEIFSVSGRKAFVYE